MRMSDRVVSDQEKIETFDSICKMVIETYQNPIRKGFERASRMGQAGHDLIEMLRTKDIVVPGQPGQEKLKLWVCKLPCFLMSTSLCLSIY